jgi:membrane protein implicated in regulation of membrane protease activity
MGINDLEKKVTYAAGAIALLIAVVLVPRLLKPTKVTLTAKPGKNKSCAAGYHLVASLCDKSHLVQPSTYWLQLVEILVLGGVMVFFAVKAKRVGVAVCALLLYLALGTAGFPFILLAAWLIMRAFRLQKYGDASFAGSGKRAREMAQEKREGRSHIPGESKKTTGSHVGAPKASKRYTPKKRSTKKKK